MAQNNVTSWDTAETLEGLDIVDKATLLDTPFRITGVEFKENNQGVRICYIDAENKDGNEFTFLDSSTGVCAQLTKYLTDNGRDAGIETGEYIECNLVAPSGLRVSEYDVPERGPNGQEIRGKFRRAKTYYLTTNGRRRGASGTKATPEAAPAKSRRTTPAS